MVVNGKPLALQKHCYLLLNKPAGVVSATEDARDRTVLELVPPALWRKGLFPAGRLDKDTTGTVVVAKNQLAAGVLWKAVDKRYYAVVLGVPTPNEGTVDRPIAQELPMEQRRIVDPD
ncbi:MAG: pseudouridine synthase, partial [Angelakisella sp.]